MFASYYTKRGITMHLFMQKCLTEQTTVRNIVPVGTQKQRAAHNPEGNFKMTIKRAVQTKAQRLEKLARDAITQYNKDMAAGSEPAFPDWTVDILSMLDTQDKLTAALKSWHQFALNNTWDDENCTFLPATRAALTSVGAL